METNPGFSPPSTTNGPCIEIPTSVKDIPTSDSYPPLIQSEGQALKYTYVWLRTYYDKNSSYAGQRYHTYHRTSFTNCISATDWYYKNPKYKKSKL